MKILFKDTFISRLEHQLHYISLDSPKRARKFYKELFARIKEIPANPYRYRKSIYFIDDTIRDMVFKGYTVVFRITEQEIEIFGFVKFQEKAID